MIPAIVTVFVLSIATAALAHFAQMTFQKGMIFRKYYALITYWFHFKPRKRLVYKLYPFVAGLGGTVLQPNGQFPGEWVWQKEKWYAWFYKPLGGCIYCNSVWLGTP